jgi:hypothetical protein
MSKVRKPRDGILFADLATGRVSTPNRSDLYISTMTVKGTRYLRLGDGLFDLVSACRLRNYANNAIEWMEQGKGD